MKPDPFIAPVTDAIFVSIPEEATPEVKDPVIHGQLIEGNVIIAARMRPLADLLARAVDESMAMMPKPPRVKQRVVREAEWSVFTDAEQCEQHELAHDCSECRDGKRLLVSFLREHPGRAVAICKLVFDEYIDAMRVATAGEFVGRGGVLTGDEVPEDVVAGETCSMCHHPLDPHELWVFGDPTEPGCPPGRMTCPHDGCTCQSEFSLVPQR